MASVELQHVDKVFRSRRDRVTALRDACLRAEDNELMVLVGPSGCGKTTTLRVIAGLESPTAGKVRIADHDVSRLAPKDRNVAMVFQNHALYPHMTVFKNMAFGLKMRRVPRDEIRTSVCEVAELLGLTNLLNRRPGALSGGECQRVALGRAIVRKPDVFLLDEPLSNLDAGLRSQMRREIKSLQSHAASTMIYVTHDQEEAMTLGQKLVVMNHGVVQQVGEPLDIYQRPANRFVAGFIGTPRMNFLPGRIERPGHGAVFACECLRVPVEKILGESSSSADVRDVVLGFRPEDLRIVGSERNGGGAPSVPYWLEAKVESIDALGSVAHANLVTPQGLPLVVGMAPGLVAAQGESVRVALDAGRAHLFAASEAGERVAGCEKSVTTR